MFYFNTYKLLTINMLNVNKDQLPNSTQRFRVWAVAWFGAFTSPGTIE
jgi:hypothetical protein